jgi:hypothetical protein
MAGGMTSIVIRVGISIYDYRKVQRNRKQREDQKWLLEACALIEQSAEKNEARRKTEENR